MKSRVMRSKYIHGHGGSAEQDWSHCSPLDGSPASVQRLPALSKEHNGTIDSGNEPEEHVDCNLSAFPT